MTGQQWRQIILKSREDFEQKHKVDIDQALKISLEEAEKAEEKRAIAESIKEQAAKEKQEDMNLTKSFFESLKQS